jgi:3-methyladenine DNA glycosylase AlkD
VAAEITAQLRRMGDPARAQGTQRYFSNEIVSLGITAAELRLCVRARMSGLRKVWRPPEAIQLCDCLLREPELEVRGAGFLALAAFRTVLTPALLRPAESWLERRLDNWALVDGFCGSVLSPLLERHPAGVATLRRWSGAKSLWVRRAALVTLVPFARRGELLDLAYAFAREHFPDREDLMHKAAGWLLREAGKTDPPRLRKFLLRHGPAIPRTTLRYAIERFSAAERARLLEATR